MTTRGVAPAIACTALAVLVAGCAPPMLIAGVSVRALQSGAAVYTDGRLEGVAVISMEEIFEATIAVLEELQFTVVTKRTQEKSAYIEAKELSGRKIKIWLYRKTPLVTKANLRVGLLGDQAMSRLIFARVADKLGIGPAINPEMPFQPELYPDEPDVVPPAPDQQKTEDATGG